MEGYDVAIEALLTLPKLRWLHFDAGRFVSVGNWFLAVESQRKLSGQKGAIHQVVGSAAVTSSVASKGGQKL